MSEPLCFCPIGLPAPAVSFYASSRQLLAIWNHHPRILVPFPVFGPKWACRDYAGDFPITGTADSEKQNDENGT